MCKCVWDISMCLGGFDIHSQRKVIFFHLLLIRVLVFSCCHFVFILLSDFIPNYSHCSGPIAPKHSFFWEALCIFLFLNVSKCAYFIDCVEHSLIRTINTCSWAFILSSAPWPQLLGLRMLRICKEQTHGVYSNWKKSAGLDPVRLIWSGTSPEPSVWSVLRLTSSDL